jgi:putative cardiolipin synthase
VPSTAIRETDATRLGRAVSPLVDAHPGMSGFYAMPNGIEALAARLRLVERAEAGIDVQYYLILPDVVGDLLIHRLMEAAERGVRVRILLDDISTRGYEKAFAVLSANSNIEIRLTNPFSNRGSRLAAVTEFQRVNHRMHNKSITVDNAITIVGGRNMGAEYFGAGDEFNFHDFDVVAVGPVVDEVSTEFDAYWNAGESLPVSAFVKPDDSAEAAEALRARFEATVHDARITPYVDALQHAIDDLILSTDQSPLVWAPARVVYDLPYGTKTDEGVPGPEVLGGILIDAMGEATEEFFLVSPYFVPGDSGVEGFRQLRERGVRCVVLTNSLASVDVLAVYGGYKEYQKPLLEMGVELWELIAHPEKPRDQPGALTEKRALHAKLFAVDRKMLFVGSFNWDPRSQRINTEMGMLIESDELASRVSKGVSAGLPDIAWKLRLNDKGALEWLEFSGEEVVIHTKPPQTSFWRRFRSNLFALDAIEGQL